MLDLADGTGATPGDRRKGRKRANTQEADSTRCGRSAWLKRFGGFRPRQLEAKDRRLKELIAQDCVLNTREPTGTGGKRRHRPALSAQRFARYFPVAGPKLIYESREVSTRLRSLVGAIHFRTRDERGTALGVGT
jgi:hypothetical protein